MQIGFDVGATKIESVVLKDSGEENFRERTECPKDYNSVIKNIVYHSPVFFIEDQGSFGSKCPSWSISIEILSGDLTNAICPSLGGRLIVTPISFNL